MNIAPQDMLNWFIYINILFIMRKFVTAAMLIFSVVPLCAQQGQTGSSSKTSDDEARYTIPLIGSIAPTFTAGSTNGTINFPDDFGKSWKILLSHPQDFTPVCSSEIIELANHQKDFDKLDAKLIVLSSDELSTHSDWKKALEELSYKGEPIEKIRFPLVDDQNKVVSKMYGMMHPQSNSTRDVRGVFVVDPDNIIQAIYFYPMGVGRSTDELLRLVSALQATSKGNVLAPANWQSGSDLLVRIPPDVEKSQTQINDEGLYKVAWFMWYKKNK
jgi:peroxiredoxin (alkyl hydroperoxide reductase subunit C)